MSRRRLLTTYTALLSLWFASIAPFAYGGGDPAKLMPKDTLVFLGSSQLVDPDSADARQIEAIAEAAKQWSGDNEETAMMLRFSEMARDMTRATVAVGLLNLEAHEGEPAVNAALVVSDTKASQALHSLVVEWLLPEFGMNEMQEVTVGGAKLRMMGEHPFPFHAGLVEDKFVLTVGPSAAKLIVEHLTGDQPDLTANERFGKGRQKLSAGGEADFSGFVDVAGLLAAAKALGEAIDDPMPPEVDAILKALAVDHLQSLTLHASKTDAGTWFRCFAAVDGGYDGVFKLFEQQPLGKDDLAMFPADAYYAKAWNLNLAQLWQNVLDTTESIDADAYNTLVGAAEMPAPILGFSLTSDLLPAFGDTWAIYDAPSHGGLLLSGGVLVVEADETALQGILSRVMQIVSPLAAQEDVHVKLQQTEIGKRSIHYVVIGGLPIPVAPAWGFADGRWVFGLHPQTVAIALEQVDSSTRKSSLTDREDFKRAVAGGYLGKEMLSFGYLDSQYCTKLLYAITLWYQTASLSMVSAEGVEIDFGVIAGLAEVLGEAKAVYASSSRGEDGIVYSQVGSGAATLVVVAAAAMGVSILLPSLSRARYLAKRTVSLSNLRSIGTGCHVYANDNDGDFPATLQSLLDGSSITPEVLQSPLQRDTEAYVYVTDQTWSDDARNVLAYERPVTEEGTAVLYLDGHVEWVDMWRFQEELGQTYNRLGREDEIPAEFRE